MELARPMLLGVTTGDDHKAAIAGANVVVIVAEWNALRALDAMRVKVLANAAALVDLRNVYDPELIRSEGLTCVSIARACAQADKDAWPLSGLPLSGSRY